jgi:hypothetical protein
VHSKDLVRLFPGAADLNMTCMGLGKHLLLVSFPIVPRLQVGITMSLLLYDLITGAAWLV